MLAIFLDTETNGLNPFHHAVLEIAFKIVNILNGEIKEGYEAVIFQPIKKWKKSDPSSLQINGFTYKKIMKEGKAITLVSEEIIAIFEKENIQRERAVFICQNPSFDRTFFSQIIPPSLQKKLNWPYKWLDLASMYWAIGIQKGRERADLYPWITGLSKDKIAETHGLAREGKPHRAMNGVDHLILCYQHVIGFESCCQINSTSNLS